MGSGNVSGTCSSPTRSSATSTATTRNWGVLSDRKGHYRLAPVYDNGNSFNNKRTEAAIERRLSKDELIRQDALDVRSCYITDKGKPIAPLKYIASGQDPQCTLAFGRFMERYEPDRLYSLIDSIPEQAMGVTVLPEGFKEYHKAVMAWRYENVFVPAWEDLRGSAVSGARPAIGTSVGRTVWNRDPRRLGRDEAGSREMILVRGIRACGLSHSHRAHRLRSRRPSRPRVRLS